MKKQTKKFLLQKFADKWLLENNTFVEDYSEICSAIMMFKMNYGIDTGLILKTPEENKGRGLGIGAEIDELFNAQKITNEKN